VYGTCESGSFAEYAAAPEKRLASKPANISFEQAAVAPISGVHGQTHGQDHTHHD